MASSVEIRVCAAAMIVLLLIAVFVLSSRGARSRTLTALWVGLFGLGFLCGAEFARWTAGPARFRGRAGALGGSGAGKGPGAPSGLLPFHGERLTAAELAAVTQWSAERWPAGKLPWLSTELPADLPWRESPYLARTTLHLGQRKLLLSEIDFLTDFARRGDTVLYAGSAPGTHIPFLATLFLDKGLKYVLYDPRPFDFPPGADPDALAAITTRQAFFTDEVAREFAGRDDLLFVSDIRTGTDEGTPAPETVASDMRMQEGWVRAMQPRAAMLKFRLDYGAPEGAETAYLAGSSRIQAWGPRTTTETRLIAERPFGPAVWRPREHESQMYYYNGVVREWGTFDHGVPPRLVRGLDHCADCAREVRIWAKYLGDGAAPARIAELMNRATRSGLRGLSHPPHGLMAEALSTTRRDALDKALARVRARVRARRAARPGAPE